MFEKKKHSSFRAKQSREYFIKEKNRKVKIFIFGLLIIVSLSLILYFLFFSKNFQIQEIKINRISSLNLISDREIEQMLDSLNEKNIFLFKKKKFMDLLKNDSRIDLFQIKKKWPNVLIINLSEIKPAAILMGFANNNCFLNKKGQPIFVSNFSDFTTQNKSVLEKMALPAFYDQTGISFDNPEYTQFLKNILALINNDFLKQNKIEPNLVKITQQGTIFEAVITTNEGWKIYVNSEINFDEQTTKLVLILKDKIKSRRGLEHIDLRFGEKIFYQVIE